MLAARVRATNSQTFCQDDLVLPRIFFVVNALLLLECGQVWQGEAITGEMMTPVNLANSIARPDLFRWKVGEETGGCWYCWEGKALNDENMQEGLKDHVGQYVQGVKKVQDP